MPGLHILASGRRYRLHTRRDLRFSLAGSVDTLARRVQVGALFATRGPPATLNALVLTAVSRYRGVTLRTRSLLMTTRARTLRLTAEEAETLEAIAGVDEVSVNEEIRRAIAAYIEARRRDADFRKRLEASIDRNKEILERLAR